jgi:hypothetical protein
MVWVSRGEKPEGGLGRLGTLSVRCAVHFIGSNRKLPCEGGVQLEGVRLAVFRGKEWVTRSWAKSRQFLILVPVSEKQ